MNDIVSLANEYVYWSNVLEKECADILEDYQERVFDLLWREVKEGKEEELLLYGSGAMESLQLDVKNKFDVVLQKIREKQIEMFIEYLRANTSDKKAYEYSTKLREYSNRAEYEQIISKQIGKLLLKSSFPINSVTKDKYNTCCNIIIVLHKYMEEVDLQIFSLARRNNKQKITQKQSETMINKGKLVMDHKKHKVFWNNVALHLTRQEYNFLYLLAVTPMRVYTFEQIYQLVWKDYSVGDIKNIIWCLVKRLRKKLNVVEDGAGNCIVSVRDIGYKFELNNENEQQ